LPPDVTDASNSIPGACLSVHPSVRSFQTPSKTRTDGQTDNMSVCPCLRWSLTLSEHGPIPFGYSFTVQTAKYFLRCWIGFITTQAVRNVRLHRPDLHCREFLDFFIFLNGVVREEHKNMIKYIKII